MPLYPMRIRRFVLRALAGAASVFLLVGTGLAQGSGSSAATAREVVSASDPAFRYQGRFDMGNPAAPVIVWESSRISVGFSGTSLALLFGRSVDQNYFNVQVDGEIQVVAVEPGSHAEIPWPVTLGQGLHHLVLIKRSEAAAGSAAFKGIEVASGAVVERPAASKAALRMLFLGDSITVGACDEDGAADQWDSRRTHNATLSYAALTADAFGADFENISVSGIGVVTGYVDVTFDEVWDRLYPARGAPRADLTAWRPDVIFLNLGGNDTSYSKSKGRPFPTSFANSYFMLVSAIRRAYPDAQLVLLRGGMSETEDDPVLIAAWTEAVRRYEAQDSHSTHFVFLHHTDLHPRVADHRIMADELIHWLLGQAFMPPRLASK